MRLLSELLDLVLPLRCAGCGDAPGLLCTTCLDLLNRPPRHAVPSPAPPGLPLPWAAAGYEGAVRAMIVAQKESGRTGLAEPLGAALARSLRVAIADHQDPGRTRQSAPPGAASGRNLWAAEATEREESDRAGPGVALGRGAQAAAAAEHEESDRGQGTAPGRSAQTAVAAEHGESDRGGLAESVRAGGTGELVVGEGVLVVPVPSRRAAVRRRGYDATQRITAAAVAALRADGIAVRQVAALAHARRVADQAALATADRVANLAGALRVISPADVAGRRVIIVDDVITTGATIAEAARALRVAGADVPAAAVVAATRRRYDPG